LVAVDVAQLKRDALAELLEPALLPDQNP